jgi:hypothetical protein
LKKLLIYLRNKANRENALPFSNPRLKAISYIVQLVAQYYFDLFSDQGADGKLHSY